MSNDGRYIITYYNAYENLDEMIKEDMNFLMNKKYGGEIMQITYYCFYYRKTKHRLDWEDFEKLNAEQVLESVDGDYWQIVYANHI